MEDGHEIRVGVAIKAKDTLTKESLAGHLVIGGRQT